MSEDAARPPHEDPARLWIERIRQVYPSLAWREVVGLAITTYPDENSSTSGLPENTPIKPEHVRNRQKQDLTWRAYVFACTAPKEMQRAGFMDSSEPAEPLKQKEGQSLEVSKQHHAVAQRVLNWHETVYLEMVKSLFAGKSRQDQWRVLQAMLVHLAKPMGTLPPAIQIGELAHDMRTAEQSASPGLYDLTEDNPSEDENQETRAEAICSMLAHIIEHGGFSIFVRDGRFRLGNRQIRDKLASDSEKRKLATKGESLTVSRDALDTTETLDQDSEDPAERAEVNEIIHTVQQLRDALPPAQAAALEYLLPLDENNPEPARKDLAERYHVTEEAIRHAEPRVRKLVVELRKRLA